MIRSIAIAAAVLALDLTPVRAADAPTLIDSIIWEAKSGKAKVAALQSDLGVARADAQKWERSAYAWEGEYNDIYNSVPYWIGWLIWVGFKWWALAVAATFVLRMIFVYWGGPVGAVGAQVTTNILGLLTFFLTYLTNIPDNLYFRRQLDKAGVKGELT